MSPQSPAQPIPARRAWLAMCALAFACHLGAFALLATVLRVEVSDDLRLFLDYGRRLAAGQVPYRDFPLEYPPLAALAFWLPVAPGPATTLAGYRLGFGLLMLGCDLLAVGAALAAWRRHLPGVVPLGALAVWPLWLLIAGQSLALERFDLWPAALVVLAIALHACGRTRLAWLVVGLGAASKLYPLLLAPLFLIAQGRRRTRRQVAGDLAACLAAIVLPAIAATRGAPLAVRGFFDYHLARGLEIESLLASLLLIGRFAGGEFGWAFRYGSIELVAPRAALAASLALPLTLLAVGATYLVAWRSRPPDTAAPEAAPDPARFLWLIRASLAAITAFAAFGKVLSPQYLLWLIPLAALLHGRRSLPAWAALTLVLLLTRTVNPLLWEALGDFAPAAIVALLARNATLLAFLALLLLPARAPQPIAAPTADETDRTARTPRTPRGETI